MSHTLIYVTCESLEEGKRIGRALVEERLVACVNLIPGMIPIFRWEDRIEEGAEVVLLAKTTNARFEPAMARIRALHSYSCPCVLSLPITDGEPDFLSWIDSEVEGEA